MLYTTMYVRLNTHTLNNHIQLLMPPATNANNKIMQLYEAQAKALWYLQENRHARK